MSVWSLLQCCSWDDKVFNSSIRAVVHGCLKMNCRFCWWFCGIEVFWWSELRLQLWWGRSLWSYSLEVWSSCCLKNKFVKQLRRVLLVFIKGVKLLWRWNLSSKRDGLKFYLFYTRDFSLVAASVQRWRLWTLEL